MSAAGQVSLFGDVAAHGGTVVHAASGRWLAVCHACGWFGGRFGCAREATPVACAHVCETLV